MIKSIRLVNFKNFADETLRVGPFTVIVGANASGKSNIRDAFRFLHGIGRGYSLAEMAFSRSLHCAKTLKSSSMVIVRPPRWRAMRSFEPFDTRDARGGNKPVAIIDARWPKRRSIAISNSSAAS